MLMFWNMFQGQGQDQDQDQGQGQDHEKMRRRSAPLQLQMVMALTLTLVLLLTLALAPSGMISKKGVLEFCPSTGEQKWSRNGLLQSQTANRRHESA